MDNVYHQKEEEGVFFGEFSYLSEGVLCGSYEAKCSPVCLNIILQQERFRDGLAVAMDEVALTQALDSLHIKTYFGISELAEMENLFLVNWRTGQLEVFGSILAINEVLKSENLNLLPLTASLHPVVSAANLKPEDARGYLFYLNDHWMVLRQLGLQWYKFDPWLGGPQLLTHFYVSLYVKQLVADGKLVFIIDGMFPNCPADVVDETLLINLEQQEPRNDPGKLSVDMTEQEISEGLRFLDLVFEDEDNMLALGLLLSLEDDHRRKREEAELNRLTKVFNRPVESSSSSVLGHMTPSSGPVTNSLQTSSTPQQLIALRTELPTTVQPNRPLISVRPCNSSGNLISSGPLTQANRTLMRSKSDETSAIAKRKNGTSVGPQLVSQTSVTLHSDFVDQSLPFSWMFLDHGEEASCVDVPLPANSPSRITPCSMSTSSQISQPSLSPQIISNVHIPRLTPQSQPTVTPRVFISSSDATSFRKVLQTGDREDESPNQDRPMCCICWTEPPSHALIPCGHMCLCESCSLNIVKPAPAQSLCPLCKQRITSVYKIFI